MVYSKYPMKTVQDFTPYVHRQNTLKQPGPLFFHCSIYKKKHENIGMAMASQVIQRVRWDAMMFYKECCVGCKQASFFQQIVFISNGNGMFINFSQFSRTSSCQRTDLQHLRLENVPKRTKQLGKIYLRIPYNACKIDLSNQEFFMAIVYHNNKICLNRFRCSSQLCWMTTKK